MKKNITDKLEKELNKFNKNSLKSDIFFGLFLSLPLALFDIYIGLFFFLITSIARILVEPPIKNERIR